MLIPVEHAKDPVEFLTLPSLPHLQSSGQVHNAARIGSATLDMHRTQPKSVRQFTKVLRLSLFSLTDDQYPFDRFSLWPLPI